MLGTPAAPTVQTERLTLRGWRADDLTAYVALVSDPVAARFITRKGKPYSEAEAWAEIAFFIGHWQMLGYGMFVVEERTSRAFVGRVRLLRPPTWPDLEIAWAILPAARRQGYAAEAGEAAMRWCFNSFHPARIISIIHPDNAPSQQVARRLGERRTGQQFAPFGEQCDVWEKRRD